MSKSGLSETYSDGITAPDSTISTLGDTEDLVSDLTLSQHDNAGKYNKGNILCTCYC